MGYLKLKGIPVCNDLVFNDLRDLLSRMVGTGVFNFYQPIKSELPIRLVENRGGFIIFSKDKNGKETVIGRLD